MEIISNSLKETEKIAHDFVNKLQNSGPQNNATVVGLMGDLGSGKTTFTKAVASSLGIKNSITSPTFVIEKIYKIEIGKFKKLIHIDVYRLESSKELSVLNWNEIVNNPENLILIEWAEKVQDLLPKDSIKIEFEFIDENKRKIKF